jgi:hypothetical protein
MGFFDFLGGVGAILGQIASSLSYLFAFLWNALVAVFQFLWDTLVAEHAFNNSMFGQTGKLFEDIYKRYLKVAVLGIIARIKRLYDHIRGIVEKIKEIVEKWQGLFYKYFWRWFILALEILATIRAVLLLFRLMGFNWAKKLDADLAKIQAFITTVLQDIVGGLNDAISILQVAIDPEMIIRRDFFAHTLFGSLAAVKRAVGYGNNRPLTPDEQKRADNFHDAVFGANGPARVQPDGTLLTAPAFAEVGERLNAEYAKEGLPAQ